MHLKISIMINGGCDHIIITRYSNTLIIQIWCICTNIKIEQDAHRARDVGAGSPIWRRVHDLFIIWYASCKSIRLPPTYRSPAWKPCDVNNHGSRVDIKPPVSMLFKPDSSRVFSTSVHICSPNGDYHAAKQSGKHGGYESTSGWQYTLNIIKIT